MSRKTAFSKWLDGYKQRYNKTINISDIDFVIHSYGGGWYITLEEKIWGSERKKSNAEFYGQTKIYNFIERALKRGSKKKDIWPNDYDPEYRGHYLVYFSHTTPDDSEWIEINGIRHYDSKRLDFLLTHGYLEEF